MDNWENKHNSSRTEVKITKVFVLFWEEGSSRQLDASRGALNGGFPPQQPTVKGFSRRRALPPVTEQSKAWLLGLRHTQI